MQWIFSEKVKSICFLLAVICTAFSSLWDTCADLEPTVLTLSNLDKMIRIITILDLGFNPVKDILCIGIFYL